MREPLKIEKLKVEVMWDSRTLVESCAEFVENNSNSVKLITSWAAARENQSKGDTCPWNLGVRWRWDIGHGDCWNQGRKWNDRAARFQQNEIKSSKVE